MRILDKKRSTYKRTVTDGKKCVFCNKAEILECPGLMGKYWKVLVNRYPYMDGNLMIVPIRHIEKIEDVEEKEWQEFGLVLKKTQQVLGKAFKTKSFNVALNVGSESGASIAHLHWQIVPRKFKNITALNTFADLYIVAITPEETKKMIDAMTKK